MGILKVISVSGDAVNEYTIDTLNVEKEEELYTEEYLRSLGMPDVRKIGYKFGVKDTSKAELIKEILKAQEL